LESIEQVIGISVTAPPSAQSGGAPSAGGLGANLNIKV
jgi:hypothetical protein